MPAKKRPAKKAKRPQRQPQQPITVVDRKRELQEVTAHAIAREPVEIVPTPVYSVGALLVQRNWLALIPGDEPELALTRLLEYAMGPEGNTDSWNDILLKAGIPWIAWSIMRDDLEDAGLVYTAWQRRVASHYAHETVTLADGLGWLPLEMQLREKLRVAARKWLAERYDPAVFGLKTMTVKKTSKTLTVKIVDELKK